MAADQELLDDQLPAGHTPVWIEPPGGATQVQMLERVETMAGQYQDVMVLYDDRDYRVAALCRETGSGIHPFKKSSNHTYLLPISIYYLYNAMVQIV